MVSVDPSAEALRSSLADAAYLLSEVSVGISSYLASLENEGAVSEPVVRQMLSGALKRSGADIGIAVSGIAGPDGGSDDKPVGTVWLAWGTINDMQTLKTILPTDRAMFQNWSRQPDST